MKSLLPLLIFSSALATSSALAHVTYTNRNFGTFVGNGLELPAPISGQTVSSAYGWADATDADFGDSHRLRAFRFTLLNSATVTLQVTAVSGFLPAFSIYSGLAHIAPDAADHDQTDISQLYLAGLGGAAKEGSLNALGDWAIGNDPIYNTSNDPGSGVAVPASLSYLTYIGHAADGTSANYGSASGIEGDGIADSFVTGTFVLPAGSYSIFIGGADYAAQTPQPTPPATYPTFGITPTLTIVPEPSAGILLGLGALGLAMRRRCRRR